MINNAYKKGYDMELFLVECDALHGQSLGLNLSSLTDIYFNLYDCDTMGYHK